MSNLSLLVEVAAEMDRVVNILVTARSSQCQKSTIHHDHKQNQLEYVQRQFCGATAKIDEKISA